MATTAAWTTLYSRILTDRLGLEVTPLDLPGPDTHLKVCDGAGWTFVFSTNPSITPHYLSINFGVCYDEYAETLTAQRHLMLQLGQRFNHQADVVKVLPASPTDCTYLIETYLAAPGALPDPDLLTALIPTWLTTLLTTHQAVATEIEAAALYATTPGD